MGARRSQASPCWPRPRQERAKASNRIRQGFIRFVLDSRENAHAGKRIGTVRAMHTGGDEAIASHVYKSIAPDPALTRKTSAPIVLKYGPDYLNLQRWRLRSLECQYAGG